MKNSKRPERKLQIDKLTLRNLSSTALDKVVGGGTLCAGTGSCGGGQHSCCETTDGQASCDIGGTIAV